MLISIEFVEIGFNMNKCGGDQMKDKRPALVSFAVDIAVLNAVFTVLSMIPGALEKIGVVRFSPITTREIVYDIVYCIVLLTAAYGYSKLKLWGYWLMVALCLFYPVLNTFINGREYLFWVALAAIYIIILIVPARRYFKAGYNA